MSAIHKRGQPFLAAHSAQESAGHVGPRCLIGLHECVEPAVRGDRTRVAVVVCVYTVVV